MPTVRGRFERCSVGKKYVIHPCSHTVGQRQITRRHHLANRLFGSKCGLPRVTQYHSSDILEARTVPHTLASGNGRTTDEDPEKAEQGDEPEAAVLLVACGIGLVTGAGVVIFNDAILYIRHLAFMQAPVQSVAWGLWARQLSLPSSLVVIALPPTIGGLTVGLFRYLTGGFADPPGKSVQAYSDPEKGSLLTNIFGSTVLGKKLQVVIDKSSKEEAASTQPPGSRDFTLKGDEEAAEDSQRSAKQLIDGLSKPSSSDRDQESAGNAANAFQRQLKAAVAPVLRAAAAALTLGSGCSLGPEGPSVEIGRATARWLGRLLRSKQRRLLPLLAAGSGAGVAAGFNAPISGVFFAVESVLQQEPRNSETEARNSSGLTVAMVLLACVLAAVVSQAGLGDNPAFRVPQYQLQSLWELPLVVILGGACGLVSVAFSYCGEVSARAFKGLNPGGESQALAWTLMPAVGGLCTGLVALAFPEVLYQGYGNVNALLELGPDEYAPTLLLQLLAAKVAVTAICRGSGLVGGIYAPSIFMGAALGSAFGGLAQSAFQAEGLVVAAPAAYALVGVAATLAANCQVPLTAVLLLFELTQDYFIIVPTLAAVGISYWTASLPIAAQISKQLQASAGQDVGAGSFASIDGDELLPGEPLIRRIKLSSREAGPRPRSAKKDGGTLSQQPTSSGATTESTSPETLPLSLKSAASSGQATFKMLSSCQTKCSTQNCVLLEVEALPSCRRRRLRSGLELGPANGRQIPKAQGVATAAVLKDVEQLTAACGLEEACVMVTGSTPLIEALILLDEASQTAALVLDEDNLVRGILTKERILSLLETEAECKIGLQEGMRPPEGCSVELALGSSSQED